ncbi:Clp protease N-terminal domain-containing protein [Flindersiella endophytica]
MTPAPNLQELIETIRRDAGSDDPLDQLAIASSTVTELNETSDAALGYFVDRARSSGKSWVEISRVLGVSKQAVHKRFGSQFGRTNFERFTDRARAVLDAASDAAIELSHPYVGTEHLLLAQFKQPDGVSATVLAKAGVAAQDVLEAILARTPMGQEEVLGPPPWTPRAAQVLQSALSEALGLGHNYIGTEHMLLGLFTNSEGMAAKILGELGLDAETARTKVIEELSSYQARKKA